LRRKTDIGCGAVVTDRSNALLTYAGVYNFFHKRNLYPHNQYKI